jgi:hypothetical protein
MKTTVLIILALTLMVGVPFMALGDSRGNGHGHDRGHGWANNARWGHNGHDRDNRLNDWHDGPGNSASSGNEGSDQGTPCVNQCPNAGNHAATGGSHGNPGGNHGTTGGGTGTTGDDSGGKGGVVVVTTGTK